MDVRFPGLLGLEFELRRWAFQVFGIKIYWYGIIIALAFLIAVLLAVKSSKKYDIVPDNILDLVLFAAPAAIICARLFYVIFSWDQFRDNPVEIFMTRNGGLAIYGGIIGAVLVAWLYARKKKIPFMHLIDFAIPYLALGQGIGRWGNFVNQEAFGTMTALPWRMNGTVFNDYLIGKQPGIDLAKWGVHPTFLYESLLDIAIFAFLAVCRKKKKFEGEVLYLYFILYGVGRFFIEGLRTDSLMMGNIRVSQFLSALLVLVFSALYISSRARKARESDEETVVSGQSEYGSLLLKMKEEEQTEESLDSADIDNKPEKEAEEPEQLTDADTAGKDTGTIPGETAEDKADENNKEEN